MSSIPFPCREVPASLDELTQYASKIGIDRVRVATVHPVPQEVTDEYLRWLERGCNGSMGYLANHAPIRRDPALLLDGARSIVTCAISYYHEGKQAENVPAIASYAHGDDYHEVVRSRLEKLAEYIRGQWGGETRVCVDTAPIHERYWAVASGLAIRGDSGLVIVPGLGTYCFLGEILTTAFLESTPPLDDTECDHCGQCRATCPGGAIMDDGTIDARRCVSYLTIEHRGVLPAGVKNGGRLYGCDSCQQACHYNAGLKECGYPEFDLRPAYNTLTAGLIESMTQEEYVEIFRHSAIKRAKLDGLKRNVKKL